MLNNDVYVKRFYSTDIFELRYWCFLRKEIQKKTKKNRKTNLASRGSNTEKMNILSKSTPKIDNNLYPN